MLIGVTTAVSLLLITGVPTGVVPTPVYVRMTPVTWWSYPLWLVAAGLSGFLVAQALPRDRARAPHGWVFAAALATALAVGCPVCNKVILATLGTSGALSLWAPLQPALGGSAVAGLAWVVWRQRRSVGSAPPLRTPSRATQAGPQKPSWFLEGAGCAVQAGQVVPHLLACGAVEQVADAVHTDRIGGDSVLTRA